MTLYDIYPALLLVGIVGMAILWEIRKVVVARVAIRRLATAGIGFMAVLTAISVPARLVAPALLLAPSRPLTWELSRIAGSAFDDASVDTPTVIPIEVQHPGCAPSEAGPWLGEPIISYTPWSVTITMQMNETVETASCFAQVRPSTELPLVGDFLMGLVYRVQLSEPLGGRTLFDGSSLIPAERSLQ